MKKLYTLFVTVGVASLLSACNAVPPCNDELDHCNHGGPYTEERTAPVHTIGAPVVEEAAPVVVETKVEEKTEVEVKPEPTPAPAPVVTEPVMKSAEPQFDQIAK